MASRTRTYDRAKLLGQIYTPEYIVDKILDISNIDEIITQNPTILDPACGDGRFLVRIVERLVSVCQAEQLSYILSNIYGWDIDKKALESCRQNLNAITAPLGLKIAWNLLHRDAFYQIDFPLKFDLIVGNPPYIRIQNLSDEQRVFIKQTFSFCKNGSTDAYIAFFQLASRLLKPGGVCAFITPNSYFSSETGKPLRHFFEENRNLIQITNYGSRRVFTNFGTYAAITAFTNIDKYSFVYEICDEAFNYHHRQVRFEELIPMNQWRLSVTDRAHIEGVRLGDICRISVGLTTLSDAFFLFRKIEEHEDWSLVVNKNGRSVKIENELLKPIVKGSKLKTSSDPITEHILFPYEKRTDGKHKIIPEKKLSSSFPMAYEYLKSIKSELLKRDNGKPNAVAWYAFGRAQSLDSAFGKKIIFSPLNDKPNFVLYENPDCTLYSGYFIKYDGDYEALLTQLNSPRMAEFITISGKDFQGGYKGYNKKIVENFIITGIDSHPPY